LFACQAASGAIITGAGRRRSRDQEARSKELGAWRSGQQGEGLAEIYIFYFFSASLLLLANSERISYDTTTTGNSTNPNESHKAALPHILGGLESA